VRVTIVDEKGAPIPGALFYAEAYDEKGAFAFIAGVAGDAGEVPDSAREPLKMPWRRGARIALVAFADGRIPTVLKDPAQRIESDGALITLEAQPESISARDSANGGPGDRGGSLPGSALPSGLAELGFPFEYQPELAQQLAGGEHAALRATFLAAYERWAEEVGELPEREQRKLEFLRAMSKQPDRSDS
jgi:hypothetical protein